MFKQPMRIKVGSAISGTLGAEMPQKSYADYSAICSWYFNWTEVNFGHTGNDIQNRCGRLHHKHSVAAHQFGLQPKK
jgi:hypothetical protein